MVNWGQEVVYNFLFFSIISFHFNILFFFVLLLLLFTSRFPMNISIVQVLMKSPYNFLLPCTHLKFVSIYSILPYLAARYSRISLINICSTSCEAHVEALFEIVCSHFGCGEAKFAVFEVFFLDIFLAGERIIDLSFAMTITTFILFILVIMRPRKKNRSPIKNLRLRFFFYDWLRFFIRLFLARFWILLTFFLLGIFLHFEF